MNQVRLALSKSHSPSLSQSSFPLFDRENRGLSTIANSAWVNGPQKEHQASPKRNQATEMAMPQVYPALPAAVTVTVLLIGVEAWISHGQWKQHRSMSPGIWVSSLPDP